jgi:hypothetical protein
MSKLLMIAGLIAFTLTSCYYDNEEELYPSITYNCDTSAVGYSKVVSPLMDAECRGCHGASYPSTGGNIDLKDYTTLKASIDRVIGSIEHSSGYSPMPKNGNKLDNCKINQIIKWKEKGLLNN